MRLTVRLLRETDGRWLGDVPELPGVTVYGATAEEATTSVKALALRVIAEEIEHGELNTEVDTLQFSVAALASGRRRKRREFLPRFGVSGGALCVRPVRIERFGVTVGRGIVSRCRTAPLNDNPRSKSSPAIHRYLPSR